MDGATDGTLDSTPPMVLSPPEQVTEAVAYHGEGPVWSDSWGGLRWVDMLAGDLLILRPNGDVERIPTGNPVAAFVRPRTGGGYVVGTERGLARADTPDAEPTRWFDLWDDLGVRMNEGGCDPWGNLYCGSMAYDRAPGAARVYRVTPDGAVTTVVPDATIANGIDFAPDGTRAYYNDSALEMTHVFDVVDRSLTRMRAFHSGDDGRPDGLTVDSAGNVWTALNGVGRVRCYTPDATVLADVDLPVRLVTACTLGGPDGKDLYITTSRENLDDPEPEAGALFKMRVAVPGKPTLAFGG